MGEGGCRLNVGNEFTYTLSRACLPDDLQHKDKFASINAVSHLRIREERLKQLKSATEADETIQTLKTVILKGWPDTRQEIPTLVTPYFRTEMN